LLTPRRVETRARIDDLRRIEGRLDAEDLAEELALTAQEYRQQTALNPFIPNGQWYFSRGARFRSQARAGSREPAREPG
jgi:hypothetical protein